MMTDSSRRPLSYTLETGTQGVRSGEDLEAPRDLLCAGGKASQMLESQVSAARHGSSTIDGQNDRPRVYPPYPSHRNLTAEVIHPAVEISPPEAVRRRTMTAHGMAAEIVHSTSRTKIIYRFRAPIHLLVMYEKGERRGGETFVEGLPQSTLRNVGRKLTFVLAGHEYQEWYEPGTQIRRMHFYFDPDKLEVHPAWPEKSLASRLFFEDEALWQTAVKLKSLIDSLGDRAYFEALGTLLVHELGRLNRARGAVRREMRGGLAAWQQQIVRTYIEEHFAEHIPVATVAKLARLSRFHFCRAFKQSFGTTPHRYQSNCRVEHAKLLLAKLDVSVTDIGLTVGFSSSNAFATAFRKATGLAPTAYRRSLVPACELMNGSIDRIARFEHREKHANAGSSAVL